MTCPVSWTILKYDTISWRKSRDIFPRNNKFSTYLRIIFFVGWYLSKLEVLFDGILSSFDWCLIQSFDTPVCHVFLMWIEFIKYIRYCEYIMMNYRYYPLYIIILYYIQQWFIKISSSSSSSSQPSRSSFIVGKQNIFSVNNIEFLYAKSSKPAQLK